MYVARHQKEQELGTVESNWGSVHPLRTDLRQKTRGDEQHAVRIKVISICIRRLLPDGSTTCSPRLFSVVQVSLVFSESGRHQFLTISHSRAMAEPVFRDYVVIFVTPLASQLLSSCHL